MAKFLRTVIKGERGQALPIVLILLVLGGLLIVPTLNYASTTLIASRTQEQGLKECYAADAGIEYGLWKLTQGNGTWDAVNLPEEVNELPVKITRKTISIPGKIAVAWFDGDTRVHDHGGSWTSDMAVQMSHPSGYEDNEYKYEITIENHDFFDLLVGGANLMQMTAHLPPGFAYQGDLASDIITQAGVVYDFNISDDGLTLTWDFPDEDHRPVIEYSWPWPPWLTKEYRHSFEVIGPPGIENFDEENYSYAAEMTAYSEYITMKVSEITAAAGDIELEGGHLKNPDAVAVTKDFSSASGWEKFLAWIRGWETEGVTVFSYDRNPE